MTYSQITLAERYHLHALRAVGHSRAAIARALGRHRSTISRELRRNRCAQGGYRVYRAHSRALGRRSRSRRNRRVTRRLRISHETIYRYVWTDWHQGGRLARHLRHGIKPRRRRGSPYARRGAGCLGRSIATRPASVARRARIGHWEIDTVLGAGSRECIVSLVERKTGYVLIGKLAARTAAAYTRRTIRLLQGQARRVRTITADNGSEGAGYREIERRTGTRFYFATPYHAWERGTNENTNGLLRQYLPKRQSMAGLTQQDCTRIARQLNRRPRKRLGFRTPEECYES
jgi:IS30 family transposase